MNDVTRILARIETGDSAAAEQLLPLVYGELRKLASARLANEKPGQTLQATALVHEAYLRLIGPVVGEGEAPADPPAWDGRGHFFAAAAEAMRRILIERARHKRSAKGGGDLVRQRIDAEAVAFDQPSDDILAVNEALERLETIDPNAAQLVKLRYFAGLTIPQAAEVLGIAPRTADAWWAYAKAWLMAELRSDDN